MRAVRPTARLWLAVFVPLVLVFGVTGEGSTDRLSPDPVAAGVAAWSLATSGTLDLTGKHVPDNPWLVTWHHKVLSNRSPGVITAGVPAAIVARVFGSRYSTRPQQLTAAVVAASAAATLALLLLGLGAGRREAWWFAVLGALGTSTWAVASNALWTHGPDLLLILAALTGATRRRFWWCGAFLGVAATLRIHLVLVSLVIGVALAWRERAPRGWWSSASRPPSGSPRWSPTAGPSSASGASPPGTPRRASTTPRG